MLGVYSLYDSKAEYFAAPQIIKSKGEAIRAFSDVANDATTMIGKHPGDYSMFHVGNFDEQSGSLIPLDVIVSLGVAIEFISASSG